MQILISKLVWLEIRPYPYKLENYLNMAEKNGTEYSADRLVHMAGFSKK